MLYSSHVVKVTFLNAQVACEHVQSLQLCWTLCNCMDCSPSGSSVHEIIQARVLSGLPCPPLWGASSAHGKGHEEGGLTYAKAGSSLRNPPGYSRASTPPKTRVCLLYCFVLSPLTLLGAVPYHHLALSVKELTYSSN